MLFVDSNVILDVITADPNWSAWSATQLAQALDAGPVLINAIVYAEIAFASDAIEAVDALLPQHLYSFGRFPARPPSSPPWPTRTTASAEASAQ